MSNQNNIMKTESQEYVCWHEVGHAMACIHFGGKVNSIEFYPNHAIGKASSNCENFDENQRIYTACGGFAAEYNLHTGGYVEVISEKEKTQLLFKSATCDRKMILGLPFESTDPIPEEFDRQFMYQAIDVVAPILAKKHDKMKLVVSELLSKGRLDGSTIYNLLT